MKQRPRNIIAGTLAALTLAWGSGLLWFASTMPDHVADTATKTDAIVVLTGGSGRIETGLRLMADGLGERLFISGVGEHVIADDVLDRGQPLQPDNLPHVAVGSTASDTTGNAAEAAAWARIEG